jgi:hypothetical protein
MNAGHSLEQSLLLTSVALIVILSAVSALRYWCFDSLETERLETHYVPIPRAATNANQSSSPSNSSPNSSVEENPHDFNRQKSLLETLHETPDSPGETPIQSVRDLTPTKQGDEDMHLHDFDSESSVNDPLRGLHETPSETSDNPNIPDENHSSNSLHEPVEETSNTSPNHHPQSPPEDTLVSAAIHPVQEEPDLYPADIIGLSDYEGFEILKYTTTIQVIRKVVGSNSYLVVVGPSTTFEEYNMPQAHQHFLKDITTYETWKRRHRIFAFLLSLGLVNMSHFTRMDKAQRRPPTDVEFFRTFDSRIGSLIFTLRWGIFYGLVSTSETSNLCETSTRNFFYGLLLSLYVFHSRMNLDTAQLIHSLLLIPPDLLFCQYKIINLSNFFFLFQTTSFSVILDTSIIKSWTIPLLDISFTFWACLEILRSKFCSGTYLLNITGYAFLLVFDRIIFEMFGAIYLDFYVYESKVKAMNTYSSTMYYTNAMNALFLLLVLLPIIYFLLLSHIIDPLSEDRIR